jgi:hypothetical protein
MRVNRRIFRIVWLLAATSVAAACNTAEIPRPTTRTPPDFLTVLAAPWSIDDLTDVPLRDPRPPRPKVKPPVPPENAPEGPVKVSPEFLVGLSEPEVAMVLGPASARLFSTPSQILVYRFGQCRLQLFLYADLKTEIYRVLHLKRHALGGRSRGEKQCFASVANYDTLDRFM